MSAKAQTSKTPCILLHGWGQSSESMRTLGDLLSHRYDIHLLTLPGFGKSEEPPSAWSAEDYANWLYKYLEEQRISSCIVVGHSFGGKVALCLSYLFPQKIHRLVLLAASGLKKKRSLKSQVALSSKIFIYKLLRFFSLTSLQKSWEKRIGSRDYLRAKKMMQKILVKSVNEDLTNKLSSIKCHTQILWGEKDLETPLEFANRFKKHIAKSSLHTFKHFDHYLLDGVRPHLLARYILKEDCM